MHVAYDDTHKYTHMHTDTHMHRDKHRDMVIQTHTNTCT